MSFDWHFRALTTQTKARLQARALMPIKIDMKIWRAAIGLLLEHFRPALARRQDRNQKDREGHQKEHGGHRSLHECHEAALGQSQRLPQLLFHQSAQHEAEQPQP
jgi:hypothetical protein